MRITAFDGLRGFFLVFMTVNHLNAILHTTIGRITPGALGFVENAHGFVLMSGLVVGLVYGKRLIRQGAGALDQAIRDRMWMIWRWHASLILLFLAMTVLTAGAPSVLAGYVADPFGLPLASLIGLAASEHMGILPMYLWFMAATPLILRAFQQGEMTLVLAVSAALWMFAQSGAGQEMVARAELWFAGYGYDSGFGLFFNVFGWQAVFVAGLAIGWLIATDKLSLSWLNGPVVALAFALFLMLFGLDRLVNDGILSEAQRTALIPLTDRGSFALVHLLSTAVDAVLVTWLLTRGATSPFRTVALAGQMLTRVLTFAPLVRLGQHSLQIFAAHLPLIYLVRSLHEAGAIPVWAGSLIIVAAPFYLYAVALLYEAAKRPRAIQTAA